VGLSALIGVNLAATVARMPRLKSLKEMEDANQFDSTSLYKLHRRMVLKESIWMGLLSGLKTGFIIVPVVVLSYALIIRLVFGFPLDTYWHYALPLLILVALGWISEKAYLLVFWAVIVGIRWWLTRPQGLAEAYDMLWQLVRLALEVGVIWAVPAVVLGVLAPYLRSPSQFPWLWSPLALMVAGIVALLAAIATGVYFIIPAALFMLGGAWLIRGTSRKEDFWPLIATGVAVTVLLLITIVTRVAPLAVYRNIFASVVPPAMTPQGWTFLKPTLEKIKKLEDPASRLAEYQRALTDIENDIKAHKDIQVTDDVKGLVNQTKGNKVDALPEMRSYICECIALEAAILGIKNPECRCSNKPRRAEEARRSKDDDDHSQHRTVSRGSSFAMTTMGSVSFWLTLGLLASWHLRRKGEATAVGSPAP